MPKPTRTSIASTTTRAFRRSLPMQGSSSAASRRRRLLHPRNLDDLDFRIEHLALERAFALGGRDGRGPDLLHDVHAVGHMTEGGEPGSIAAGAIGVEAGLVRQQNEEIGRR